MNVHIRADVEPMLSALREAESLLAEAPECSLEVRDRLLGFLDSGLELSAVEIDLSTSGTGDLCARFKLADGFLELVAALRAGEFQRRIEV
jgi:hypothetical protein